MSNLTSSYLGMARFGGSVERPLPVRWSTLTLGSRPRVRRSSWERLLQDRSSTSRWGQSPDRGLIDRRPFSGISSSRRIGNPRNASGNRIELLQQRWLSGQSIRHLSGRLWVQSPTASYQRRYISGTRCFLVQRSAYKDRSGFSLLSNLVKKKIWIPSGMSDRE